MYNSPCINSKVDAFFADTSETINIVFPWKTIKEHEDDKLFISVRIMQMISERDKLCQQGKADEFRSLRKNIIPEIRITLFARYLAGPLTHIFSESFTSWICPDKWKISKVCGIPKCKPCCSVDLLRSISLKSESHTPPNGFMKTLETKSVHLSLVAYVPGTSSSIN